MKHKKIILGSLAVGLISAVPIFSVISCGDNQSKPKTKTPAPAVAGGTISGPNKKGTYKIPIFKNAKVTMKLLNGAKQGQLVNGNRIDVTYTLNKGYEWSDSSTGPISLTYTVNRNQFDGEWNGADADAFVNMTDKSALTEINFAWAKLASITIVHATNIPDDLLKTMTDKTTLKHIIISGTSIKSIGDAAFGGQPNIATVDFSGAVNLEYIGPQSFAQSLHITTLDLSKNLKLKEINDQAFHYSPLTTITLPKSVNNIHSGAFDGTINHRNTIVTLPKMFNNDTQKGKIFSSLASVSNITFIEI